MLSKTIRSALHHPRLMAALCVVLLVYGGLLARTQTEDVFPNLAPATASVETEAPGLVAEQVEALVTRPIETALLGAQGVAAMRSQSIQGVSVITLDFQSGADPNRVRQAISEGLAQTQGLLPEGVGAPHLSPLTSGDGAVLSLGFTSDHLTPMALRDLVQWTVRPRLLSVPSVAAARLFGGETRRIEVRARAGDLSDSDLGYDDVFGAVRRATGVSGAGFIDTPTQRVGIEPHGQALNATDVEAGQIQVVGSAPVRISDVADVVDAPAPAFSDALVMGKPGVILKLVGRYGANRAQTSVALNEALDALRPTLQKAGVSVRTDLARPADFMNRSVHELLGELAVGAVILAGLLVLLLRDWRAALISLISIPLSILAAMAVLKGLGWSLNTMTLGGLAVALGLVVDDAVIDVESIVSQLRTAEVRHASRSHAILAGSLGVRAPVIYVTLMVVVALLPIVALGGVQGALLRPLAVSVIVAALASLGVAIVITPPLALLCLNHIGPTAEPPIVRRLKALYDRVLSWADRTPLLWGATALLILASVAILAALKSEGVPTIHGDQLTAEIQGPASTSMAVMRGYGQRITHDLVADPAVLSVDQAIGRAETGEEAWGPEHATLEIALKPGLSASQQDDAARRIRQDLSAYPGLESDVRSSLGISALGDEAGHKIKAQISGNDLDALDATAKSIGEHLRASPGVRNVTVTAPMKAPVVRIDLNFQRLAIYGLSAADVLNTVQTAFEGRTAAQIYEGDRSIDIAVTADVGLRQDPEKAGDLLLRSSSGVSVPLKTVANVYLTDGRTRIDHEAGLRTETVLADPPKANLQSVRRVEAETAKAVSPVPGSTLVFAGSGDDQGHQLWLSSALAAGGVVVLLLLAFGDVRSGLLVLISTLFALVGAVGAILLMGGGLSLGAFVGFFALFGLSARNATLLITRLDQLVISQDAPWSAETVRRAAHDRVSPMVISALTVVAALLPIAVRADTPGHEILAPMVFVIVGGLASSTLIGLLLLPSLAFRVWRPGRPITLARGLS